MLSTLLPGVRELRTPLITGALWAACLWLLVGFKLVDADPTQDFLEQFHLNEIPTSIWIGGAALFTYLVGSLLVVRSSPLTPLSRRILPRSRLKFERLYEDRIPQRFHHRVIWKFWQRISYRHPFWKLHSWTQGGPREEPIDEWLRNEFQRFIDMGRVPIMKSTGSGGCYSTKGFDGFYSPESIQKQIKSHPDEWGEWNESMISASFAGEIKNEQSAISTRIQMRFPDIYAEIDRLKVEAELRFSIFWPLMILSLTLAWTWSTLALTLTLVPPFLLIDGFTRKREASERTWSVLMAREVTSPIIDSMENSIDAPIKDFQEQWETKFFNDTPLS